MLKLLPYKLNPVVVFFAVLLLIVICSLAAFYIASQNSHTLGIPPSEFTIKEVYRNEPWTFSVNNFSMKIPGNSYVAPVYLEDKLIGIAVQGEDVSLQEGGKQQQKPFDNFFLTLNSEIYSNIKGDTIFLPLENPVIQSRSRATLIPLVQLPEVQGIIYARAFLPDDGKSCIFLEGEEVLAREYCSITPNKGTVTFFFSLVTFVVLLTIYILTVDLHPGNGLKRLYATKPQFREKMVTAIIIIALLIPAAQGKLSYLVGNTVDYHVVMLYYAIICLLLLLRKKEWLEAQDFGLASGFRAYCRGIAIVPVILSMITLFSTFKFPTKIIAPDTAEEFIINFLFILVYAFGAEFFWRGFLQTFLERLWGSGAGLLFATILSTLPAFLALHTVSGLPLHPAEAMEVLFFLPLTALLLGFLYQRSRNLSSVVLLHALILFIPGVLSFT